MKKCTTEVDFSTYHLINISKVFSKRTDEKNIAKNDAFKEKFFQLLYDKTLHLQRKIPVCNTLNMIYKHHNIKSD